MEAFATESYPAVYLMGEEQSVAASGHGLSVLPALISA